ncbi:MAG: diadenosine tetraphosphatase, partial [Acidobacteriota bacterium]
LAVRDGDRLLVHAGLWPHWTVGRALDRARRLEARLRTGDTDLLAGAKALYRRGGLGRALYAFTALRLLRPDGSPSSFKGPPGEAPAGDLPWFDAESRKSRDVEVVCGHWAALGAYRRPGQLQALDSGVAWGGPLSAVRLDDGALVQQAPVGGAR